MILVGVRKNICTTHFWMSKNCILETLGKLMSVYSSNSPFEKFCSRDVASLYLVGGLNNFLRADRWLWLVKCFKMFRFNWNFWKCFYKLIFSISILRLIELKYWNFPDNLDFKGKIVAKFFQRSHFLSICNNITVNNKLTTELFQKVCHLFNGIFHSITFVTLSQFYSVTSLALFTENNKLWNKRKEDFLYIWLLSRYIKEGRKLCMYV